MIDKLDNGEVKSAYGDVMSTKGNINFNMLCSLVNNDGCNLNDTFIITIERCRRSGALPHPAIADKPTLFRRLCE